MLYMVAWLFSKSLSLILQTTVTLCFFALLQIEIKSPVFRFIEFDNKWEWISSVNFSSFAGLKRQIQSGYPGIKDSGKTISFAPDPAASSIRATTFWIVFSLSRKIGDCWMIATLFFFFSS